MKYQNPGNALFRLIKSMNPGEKRFFNMLCGRQASLKGKLYLKLFEAFDKQTDENEALIKKQFKEEKLQYAPTKKYLYHLVLDSLVQYYRTNSEKNLYGKLLEMEVLFEKGLYDLYELMLLKVKQAAKEKNYFLIVQETLKEEKRLYIMRYKYYDPEKLKAIRQQEIYYRTLHEEIEDYRELANEVLYYHNQYQKIDTAEFRAIAERPLFKDKNKPGSFIARWVLHNLRGAYFITAGNNKQAFEEYSGLIKILESDPQSKHIDPSFFAISYNNYLIECIELQEYGTAAEILLKYKKFLLPYPELMKRKMMGLYLSELQIYRHTGKKNEAIQLMDEAKQKMTKEKIAVSDRHRLLFCVNAAFAYLDFKEYPLSLEWVNMILNFPAAEKTNLLYYYNARILQLINLFNLNENELLQYRLKAFQRSVLKRGTVSRLDKVIIDFFNTIVQNGYSGDHKDRNRIISELKNSIAEVIADPSANEIMLSYTDLSNWLNDTVK